MHVQGKLYIYAGTQRACGACLCRGGGSAAAAGTLPWGSPCALDMTAAICLLSSSLSWLRSASMPAGIALGKGLPAPPAPPPAAAAAASPSGSPSPSKLASLPMARGHAEPPRSLQAPSPAGSRRPEEPPPEPGPQRGVQAAAESCARDRAPLPGTAGGISRARRGRPRPVPPPCWTSPGNLCRRQLPAAAAASPPRAGEKQM